MSRHAVPVKDDTARLRDLVAEAIRLPDNVTANDATPGTVDFVFDDDLTGPEAATLDDMLSLSKALVLQPEDYALIKSQLPALEAFMTGTPTQGEAVAALRSVIRVLDALLRN